LELIISLPADALADHLVSQCDSAVDLLRCPHPLV
jgi:hypothetical protein